MYFIAVFNNREVSMPYSSRESLERCNAHRFTKIHTVVSSSSKEELDAKVKAVLRSISKV